MIEKRKIKILEGGISGLKYAIDLKSEEGRRILGSLQPGMEIQLRREKENRYDVFAVSIYTEDEKHKLGYVSRYKNETVARLIDQGAELHAYIADQENTEIIRKKTPTEDMLVTFSLYLVKSQNAPAIIEKSPYNEELRAKIKKFIMKCAEQKVPEGLRKATAFFLQEFVIALITTDGIIAWQEVELLQMYLAMPVNRNTLARFEILQFDFNKVPLAFQDLVDYENEHSGCSGLCLSYIEAVKALGMEAISCDHRITEEEETNYRMQISVLEHYLQENLLSRNMEIVTYTELDEVKHLYENMDMELLGMNLKQNLKKDLLCWMASEKQKGSRTSQYSNQNRLRYILGSSSTEQREELTLPSGVSTFELEQSSGIVEVMKQHLNESKLYYTEMIDLYTDVFDTIAGAIGRAE